MIVSVILPTAAMEPIGEWAQASDLSHDDFCRTSLIFGAHIMTSSLSTGFVDALTPEERHYMSESANTSVTPEILLQIVLGGKAQPNAQDPGLTTAELVINLPDEQVKRFRAAADSIGMVREKFFSLAFVTGARLAASALEHPHIFPLELLVRSIDGDVTPEEWLRAMMGRSTRSKRKKTRDRSEQ